MTPLQQFAVLHRAIDKLDLGSLADSPVAPAGTVVCFEDRTFEARFTELIRRDQARNSTAQNDDLLSFTEVGAS